MYTVGRRSQGLVLAPPFTFLADPRLLEESTPRWLWLTILRNITAPLRRTPRLIRGANEHLFCLAQRWMVSRSTA